MIIQPDGDGSCEVFVHRSASAHQLTIEVRRKRTDRPDEVMMRHVGALAFVGPDDAQDPPIHGLIIRKVTEGPKGIKMYTGAAAQPRGEESLLLAVNMGAAPFHNGNPAVDPDLVTNNPRRLLDIDPLAGRPSIFIDDGIFHTAAKTRDGLALSLKQRGMADVALEPFAALIGANIYLEDEEILALTWRNQGKLETLPLTKPADGVSYEIYIVNDPLYENDSITNTALDPKHDEFAEYYKVLTAVPTNKQFRLEVKKAVPAGPPIERGTTMIPCMTIIVDPPPHE